MSSPNQEPAAKIEGSKPSLPRSEGLVETETAVSFLGVELEKGPGGVNVPRRSRFERNVLTDYDLQLMQKIAIGFELNQSILIESGSGLGKTETVERMCSLLNREVYYANCHDFESDALIGAKTVREDTKSGFGWKDGIVVQAIRNGGVLFLDEYNFMRGETRGRLHEVLDAILRGKDEIVLVENDGERVKVHPNFRLVAAQNAPGGEYADREVLDPAQFTRFVYLKEPADMPRELKAARAFGAIGLGEKYLYSMEPALDLGAGTTGMELKAIPKIETAIRQFLDFEATVVGLVENGKLGGDQPQRVYFAFQRDFNRLLGFINRFHEDDVFETLKKGLRYYYKNRFESPADRAQVEELIMLIGDHRPDVTGRAQLRLLPGGGGAAAA